MGTVRVCITAEQHAGPEVLGPPGTGFHRQRAPHDDRAVIEAALAERQAMARAGGFFALKRTRTRDPVLA